MTRIIILAAMVFLSAFLTACGGNDYDPKDDPTACMSFDGKPVECTKGNQTGNFSG